MHIDSEEALIECNILRSSSNTSTPSNVAFAATEFQHCFPVSFDVGFGALGIPVYLRGFEINIRIKIFFRRLLRTPTIAVYFILYGYHWLECLVWIFRDRCRACMLGG